MRFSAPLQSNLARKPLFWYHVTLTIPLAQVHIYSLIDPNTRSLGAPANGIGWEKSDDEWIMSF
jgi:hypothetical protein